MASYRLRQIAQPIDFGRDDEYYISFVAGRDELVHGVLVRQRTAFRLTMRSDKDCWGPSLSTRLSQGMRPQIGLDGPTAGFTSPARYQPGQMLFWVGKIVTRRDGPDEAYLRAYGPTNRSIRPSHG